MKLVATVVCCKQVGIDAWRDMRFSRVFDSKDSFDSILEWAKKLDSGFTFGDIVFSQVEETP